MKQEQEFKKAREALLEKVAARSFAKNYLSSLRSDVRGLRYTVVKNMTKSVLHQRCSSAFNTTPRRVANRDFVPAQVQEVESDGIRDVQRLIQRRPGSKLYRISKYKLSMI